MIKVAKSVTAILIISKLVGVFRARYLVIVTSSVMLPKTPKMTIGASAADLTATSQSGRRIQISLGYLMSETFGFNKTMQSTFNCRVLRRLNLTLAHELLLSTGKSTIFYNN